jgi:hypothetical protein
MFLQKRENDFRTEARAQNKNRSRDQRTVKGPQTVESVNLLESGVRLWGRFLMNLPLFFNWFFYLAKEWLKHLHILRLTEALRWWAAVWSISHKARAMKAEEGRTGLRTILFAAQSELHYTPLMRALALSRPSSAPVTLDLLFFSISLFVVLFYFLPLVFILFHIFIYVLFYFRFLRIQIMQIHRCSLWIILNNTIYYLLNL